MIWCTIPILYLVIMMIGSYLMIIEMKIIFCTVEIKIWNDENELDEESSIYF